MSPIPRAAAILAAAILASVVTLAVASEKLAHDTGKTCTACHDKPGSKLLTDEGKYFETTRSFDGYAQLRESFGKCTACHVRRPGSHRLTKKGQQFAELAKDMAGIRKLMAESHPRTPAK